MKIAVSGKGGVGKTTFAALLVRTLGDQGKRTRTPTWPQGSGSPGPIASFPSRR